MSAEGWAVVVAIDPGGTTGWSVLAVESDCLSDPDISVLASITYKAQGQLEGDENYQAAELMSLIEMWSDAARVIEDFTLRKFTQGRELLSPVRITAKVEYALSVADPEDFEDRRDSAALGYPPVTIGDGTDGVRRMFYQSSSLALGTITDDRLKEWGLYIPGEQHARDALRHSIMFLRRANDRPALRKAAWPHLYKTNSESEIG